MKLTLKGSSAISHASYDMNTHTLTLTFTSSNQGYDYYEVPPRIVLGLKKAPSVGKYYNLNIRNQYNAKGVN